MPLGSYCWDRVPGIRRSARGGRVMCVGGAPAVHPRTPACSLGHTTLTNPASPKALPLSAKSWCYFIRCFCVGEIKCKTKVKQTKHSQAHKKPKYTNIRLFVGSFLPNAQHRHKAEARGEEEEGAAAVFSSFSISLFPLLLLLEHHRRVYM